MFAYICGGRPVETNITQVENTKFVFTVKDAEKINYLALFLLPGMQMPPEVAAAVYAKLPNKEEFQFLGSLNSGKQSAIFKLNMGTASNAMYNDVDTMMDDDEAPQAAANPDVEIIFGISIEPIAQVEQYIVAQKAAATRKTKAIALTPATNAEPPATVSSPGDVATLANKIVGHAYNFLASFVDPQGKVPIKAFDDWWAKFKSRLSADPNFLNTLS